MHIHTECLPDHSAGRLGRAGLADVVLVGAGERVRDRTAFLDVTGKLMYHCHILD